MLHAEQSWYLKIQKTSSYRLKSVEIRCVGMQSTVDIVCFFPFSPTLHAHENVEHGTPQALFARRMKTGSYFGTITNVKDHKSFNDLFSVDFTLVVAVKPATLGTLRVAAS